MKKSQRLQSTKYKIFYISNKGVYTSQTKLYNKHTKIPQGEVFSHSEHILHMVNSFTKHTQNDSSIDAKMIQSIKKKKDFPV